MALRTRFVVPVVLATLAILAGCGGTSITRPVGPSSSGFSESSLNGTYVFSVSGTTQPAIINPSGPPVPNPYAMVGTFTADGSGGITGGTLDLNVRGGTAANVSLTSGSTYTVGVDGRGQAQLMTSSLTLTPPTEAGVAFGKIILNLVLQDSTHGLVTEFDNNASGSGTLDLQSSGVTLNGSYAFIFSGGWNFTDPIGSFYGLVTVGNFTVGSGGAITGLEDLSICCANTTIVFTNQTLSGTVILGPSSSPGTQLIPSGFGKITYDVYAIDTTHLKFIEMDSGGTLSGDAFAQTSTSMPSNSTLAFTLLGNAALPSFSLIATGGFMVTDADGNISTSSEDVNNNGSVSPAPINFTGTTTTGGTGRYTLALSGFAQGTQYAAYPSSAGLLLMEIDDSGSMVGTALPQSSTASLATSQGYALNLSGTNDGSTSLYLEVDDIAEFSTSSSGTNLTGAADKNYAPEGIQSYGLKLTGSYSAPDSSGRSQLAANVGNSNNGTLNGGFSLTYYTVDGSTFPFIESDNGQAQVTVGVFLKQNSSSELGATRSHLFVMPPLVRPHISRQHQSS